MFRRAVVSSLLLMTCACTIEQTVRQPPPGGASASTLVLLTRGACVTAAPGIGLWHRVQIKHLVLERRSASGGVLASAGCNSGRTTETE